jgi:hypothetical protein
MQELGKRVACAGGIRLDAPDALPFEAQIECERRNDNIYYTCRVQAPDGTMLAHFGSPVSLRVVPAGTDPFAHALAHAIEGINRYRICRIPVFRVNDVCWR